MKAIVAIDNSWGIGNNGNLLFHIKKDMEFFRKMTTNKVVVMGRKTLDSLPNGEPLKNRINLVITSNKSYKSHDNIIFGDIHEINEEIKKYDTNDIFIIGGASIYKQFIHRCDTVYVTHNAIAYGADTYMPNLAFEGFIFKQILNEGTTSYDEYWSIEKWITSECKPYKSILWLYNSNDEVTFLYSNNLDCWNDVYTNDAFQSTAEFKKFLINKIIENDDRTITTTEIHDYYRIDINARDGKLKIRFSSFGSTKQEAKQNLVTALINLLI